MYKIKAINGEVVTPSIMINESIPSTVAAVAATVLGYCGDVCVEMENDEMSIEVDLTADAVKSLLIDTDDSDE